MQSSDPNGQSRISRYPSCVFLTGASGFIGDAVLRRFIASGVHEIRCLVRDPDSWTSNLKDHAAVRTVPGDILDETTYEEALGDADVAVHLAAATGAAPEPDMVRVNVEGTRRFAEAWARAGIGHFIHMSSIAAAGEDLSDYPYGRTKRESEVIVTGALQSATILRPTIVLGPAAPNWSMLRQLACLPVVPLFAGGRVRVQPVDVADVARGIDELVGGFRPGRPIIEFGGPEILSFADFLFRIRAACGKRRRPGLYIPVGPVRSALRLGHRLVGRRMPISPAQLTPFVNDGTATPNDLLEALRADMTPLDQLLKSIVDAE